VKEKDWLAFDDPTDMMRFLARAGDRKVRLFAVACCRRLWGLLPGPRHRDAVEVAERFADGLATQAERIAAHKAVRPVRSPPASPVAWATSYAAHLVTEKTAAATLRVCYYGQNAFRAPDVLRGPRQAAEGRAQADLVRDILGNPFRRTRVPAPARRAWLAWGGGVVRRLALAAYERRKLPEGALDPSRLAILADALEEAGCTDAELLAHLRSPGPHVRGCFALDLVLGES
jgi:hypothetical protein